MAKRKSGRRKGRKRRGEPKKLTIKKNLFGKGINFARERKLKGGADSILVENKTEFDISWRVPAGPFVGGAIDRILEPGESINKETLDHEFRIEYSHKLEKVDRTLRRKKRRILNDPVIIIDP